MLKSDSSAVHNKRSTEHDLGLSLLFSFFHSGRKGERKEEGGRKAASLSSTKTCLARRYNKGEEEEKEEKDPPCNSKKLLLLLLVPRLLPLVATHARTHARTPSHTRTALQLLPLPRSAASPASNCLPTLFFMLESPLSSPLVSLLT